MSLYDRVAEEKALKKLSDAGMKKMIPMYVSSPPGSTHDCGHCTMFVPNVEGMAGACTIVEGPIRAKGTCTYQSPGENASADKIHPVRMSQEHANYAEMDGLVNCATCQFYDGPEQYCKLWMGKAGPGDCCMAHNSPLYKEPR